MCFSPTPAPPVFLAPRSHIHLESMENSILLKELNIGGKSL